LASGEAATPSLTVYRTPEDTSQDYHIEGLPFGTRGGMLIKHVFPSDGEYQITMTPIFGDNMSPQGFGSVPCEKLEVLLDGERIELLDWQGGGRTPPATCGGRQVAAVQSGQTGLDLGRTSMKVRISTKAGPPEQPTKPHARGRLFQTWRRMHSGVRRIIATSIRWWRFTKTDGRKGILIKASKTRSRVF